MNVFFFFLFKILDKNTEPVIKKKMVMESLLVMFFLSSFNLIILITKVQKMQLLYIELLYNELIIF